MQAMEIYLKFVSRVQQQPNQLVQGAGAASSCSRDWLKIEGALAVNLIVALLDRELVLAVAANIGNVPPLSWWYSTIAARLRDGA